MYTSYKFTYTNINKTAFQNELSKRGEYYANVVMWTSLFSLPLFFLIDYLLLKESWVDLVLIRLIGFGLSYIIYTLFNKKSWGYLKTLIWFVAVNIAVHSIICGIVPSTHVLGYFLVLAVIMLIVNTTIFWPAVYSVYMCLVSYIIIFFIYSFKRRVDKYNVLIDNGGGIYFLISAFSCFLAYTRFSILGRDIERMVMLNDAHNKVLDQNEKLKEQQLTIQDNNRKIQSFDTFQTQATEFRSYTDTVQSTVDKIKEEGANLTGTQLESLDALTASNQKIGDLSNQISSAASKADDVYFNREYFNLNPEVERAVIELIDSFHLKNMSLQLNISPAANNIYQEKIVIEQVLNKLLNNVIRHSEAGSTITVRAERVNDVAVIETTSHSPYVTDDKLSQMFENLKSTALTDDSQIGEVGLGATKKQVESMGGTFYYQTDDDNKGNYFKIELPSTQ